jgi:carbamoyl-phosphate synthase/aspartate carbamoyltransferase
VIINHNPETVSTDYDEAERLYFEELSAETVEEIYWFESQLNPAGIHGLIVSMGGQAPNNIVMELDRKGLHILGTSAEMIDTAENRFKFSRMCDASGIKQPPWFQVTSYANACESATKIGYPVLVRPSYVLSGAGMAIVYCEADLAQYLSNAEVISPLHPVVISKFIQDAKEIEVDAVALNGKIVLLAIAEHVENAGVHSGDATLVLPAQDLTAVTIEKIKRVAYNIAESLNISGPLNIQIIAKNDDLEVIECNLRASRSFPFVSKTLGLNFIDIATEIILNKTVVTPIPEVFQFDRVGVKVSQFSWAKLPGSVVRTTVEMASTGEVACFGPNRNIAFLKALSAAGFKIKAPQELKTLAIYIPHQGFAIELEQSLKYMRDLGCAIISINTATDLTHQHPNLIFMCPDTYNQCDDVYKRLVKKSQMEGIPLLTNHKLIKLFCESYYYVYQMSVQVDSYFDVRVPIADIPLTPKHCPTPLPKHVLSPSVIANSLQCIAFNPVLQSPNTVPQTIDIVFTDKHILSPAQFNRNLLRQIFRKASYYKLHDVEKRPYPQLLKGKVFGLLFYTPSTRTRCSFESAIMRLGGNTIYIGAHDSSVQKGESFNDTVRTLDSYVDGIVIRAPNTLSLNHYKHIAKHSIINAGDKDEHPTQGLLDLFTIREVRGTINHLTIAIIGDCLHGRTVSSLAKLLCNYTATIYFVPEPGFEPSPALLNYLAGYESTIQVEVITEPAVLLSKMPYLDVIYMTRIQTERTAVGYKAMVADTNQITQLKWVLTPELLSHASQNLMVLHPLPRNEELPESVDSDSRALYFKQMEYGLYLRMALVDLMFS